MQALSEDELALIFSFLSWKEILKVRVCNKWRAASKLTLVPPSSIEIRGMEKPELYVKTQAKYQKLPQIIEALPNLQQLSLYENDDVKFQDGEDAQVWGYIRVHETTPVIDLECISRLKNLRKLFLEGIDLNGRYPFLFNFPRLQQLRIYGVGFLQWDLSMISNFPELQDLYVAHNHRLTGEIKSLRVLKNTLQKVVIATCSEVEGDLMDLADFPHLEELSLVNTKVKGDLRKIRENHFPKIKRLDLPDGVYGGGSFDRITEAPDIMRAMFCLKKRSPTLFAVGRRMLSHDSPDRYEVDCHHSREPPFWLEFVKVGPRSGWRWTNCVNGGDCEIHWLEEEPDQDSQEYSQYLEALEKEQPDFYKGFYQPPNVDQHEQLLRDIPLHPVLQRMENQRRMQQRHMNMFGFGF
ncbi:hypothetical protein CTEN210_16272 [Chaetoceros tenuissimus]|uniref:F-box/LRR-repeat protein 15/At3g58940/PEG3-like LRR domain-containing protein n=1 Tax=Chaetoceros tenuissimus TaxID=426638 RepID=A0AAD3DAR0_9STRA|nr:hypothetical protein CTEN210_16272 [Chaetoceros tenuissimus]